MDYKKEYENAFAIAKDWYNDPKTTEKEKCLLEAQYPELKESEDERIRKELIRFVKGYFPDETSEQRKAYLAWLEKKKGTKRENEGNSLLQGEQKNEWSDEDKKIVTELIGIFESAVDGGHVEFPYRLLKDYIRVLKSCLPQNTWKPSEE